MDSSETSVSLNPMISPLVLGGDSSASDDGSSWNTPATTCGGGVGRTSS